MTHLSGVPTTISTFAFLPITSFKYLGCKPYPGRMERTFCSVKARLLWCLLLQTGNVRICGCLLLFGQFVCWLARAFRLGAAATMAVNSFSSSENEASGPPIDLSRMKCFSITFAPKATATTGATMPVVWSDRPTSTPNRFLRSGRVNKLASSMGAG